MNKDAEHLRLLALFHYLMAGLSAVCACFPVIHLAVGIAIVSGTLPDPPRGETIPQFVGWFFIVIATIVIILGWAYAIEMAVAGRCLQRRRGYIFCFVMAILSCLQMPHGTVLAVFTLVVLQRQSVQALFGRRAKPEVPEWAVE